MVQTEVGPNQEIMKQLGTKLTQVLNNQPELEVILVLVHTLSFTIHQCRETRHERMSLLEHVINELIEDLK